MLYIIDADLPHPLEPRIKIGITKSYRSLEGRMQNHCGSSPFPLRRAALWPDYDRAVEQAILNHFQEYRLPLPNGKKSEWLVGVSILDVFQFISDNHEAWKAAGHVIEPSLEEVC